MGLGNNFNSQNNDSSDMMQVAEDAFIETMTFLEMLKEQTEEATEWNPKMLFKEFVKELTKWDPRTSTSPSGRHLDLCRALTTVNINKNDEFTEKSNARLAPSQVEQREETLPTTQEKATSTLKMTHGLLVLALRHGFTLDRWMQMTCCMTHKKTGIFCSEELRAMHLTEADLNLGIGTMFGKKAMWKAKEKMRFTRANTDNQEANAQMRTFPISFSHRWCAFPE